jgi:hypothetical protein
VAERTWAFRLEATTRIEHLATVADELRAFAFSDSDSQLSTGAFFHVQSDQLANYSKSVLTHCATKITAIARDMSVSASLSRVQRIQLSHMEQLVRFSFLSGDCSSQHLREARHAAVARGSDFFAMDLDDASLASQSLCPFISKFFGEMDWFITTLAEQMAETVGDCSEQSLMHTATLGAAFVIIGLNGELWANLRKQKFKQIDQQVRYLSGKWRIRSAPAVNTLASCEQAIAALHRVFFVTHDVQFVKFSKLHAHLVSLYVLKNRFHIAIGFLILELSLLILHFIFRVFASFTSFAFMHVL